MRHATLVGIILLTLALGGCGMRLTESFGWCADGVLAPIAHAIHQNTPRPYALVGVIVPANSASHEAESEYTQVGAPDPRRPHIMRQHSTACREETTKYQW